MAVVWKTFAQNLLIRKPEQIRVLINIEEIQNISNISEYEDSKINAYSVTSADFSCVGCDTFGL